MKKSSELRAHRHRGRHHPRHHRLACLYRLRRQQELLRHHRRARRHGRQGLQEPICASRASSSPARSSKTAPTSPLSSNEFESHSPKAATGRLLKVSYKGTEPPPDTFKDDAQALAEAPMAATASSTPRLCRPSAPASTRPAAQPGAAAGQRRSSQSARHRHRQPPACQSRRRQLSE